MGLCIHYSGSIAKPELLPALIDEIQDIANIYNWGYNVYASEFPENTFGKPGYNQDIYGISFAPPGCETIFICFLSNGRMSSPVNLMFYGKTADQPEREYLYMLSVKTQFAGVNSHQFIIQLFRYLNSKYLTGFELQDEGGYWETNDIELLKANFEKIAGLINGLCSVIEVYPILAEEDIEDYFERMLKLIQDKKKL